MSDPEDVIRAAEKVAGVLESHGVESMVIGAVALAAHGYVRFTEDLDLGVNTDLGTLGQTADALRKAGFESTFESQTATIRSGASSMFGVHSVWSTS